MADTSTTSSSTAAAPAPGEASTQVAAIDSPLVLPPPGTSVDVDSLLAGGGDAKALGTGNPSEAGGDVIEGKPAKADEPETASDTTTTTTETEAEGDPEEQEEAEALTQAQDEKVPKWVHPRLSKMAEQKAKLREQLSELESQIKARDEAEAKAAENPSTPLPTGAISHLDTVDKLDAEVTLAAQFLKEAEADPEGMVARYKDEPNGRTAEDQVAHNKRYALQVIQNQEAHRKMLTQRQATLEDVKKSTPAMFKPGTEEQAFYAKLLKADPRTDPDFHQLIADALRGKKARLELAKATAAKPTVKKEVVKVPPIPVPSAATARASVRTDDAPDARQQVWQKAAKQQAVTVDEMMDAGALPA